jgi:hypothetical protein
MADLSVMAGRMTQFVIFPQFFIPHSLTDKIEWTPPSLDEIQEDELGDNVLFVVHHLR